MIFALWKPSIPLLLQRSTLVMSLEISTHSNSEADFSQHFRRSRQVVTERYIVRGKMHDVFAKEVRMRELFFPIPESWKILGKLTKAQLENYFQEWYFSHENSIGSDSIHLRFSHVVTAWISQHQSKQFCLTHRLKPVVHHSKKAWIIVVLFYFKGNQQ